MTALFVIGASNGVVDIARIHNLLCEVGTQTVLVT